MDSYNPSKILDFWGYPFIDTKSIQTAMGAFAETGSCSSKLQLQLWLQLVSENCGHVVQTTIIDYKHARTFPSPILESITYCILKCTMSVATPMCIICHLRLSSEITYFLYLSYKRIHCELSIHHLCRDNEHFPLGDFQSRFF